MDVLTEKSLARAAASLEGCGLTSDQVIDELTYVFSGRPPRAAIEAALGLQEQLAPRLLDEICLAPVDVENRYRSAPAGSRYTLHTFAFYLLGYYGDARAFPLMLDYFASDSDLAEALSGDALGGYLPALLVRCYDGTGVSQLKLAIETSSYAPLFRYECFRAYHGLVLSGRAERAGLLALTRRLLDVPVNAGPDRWYGWLGLAAAELQEPSLRPHIAALIDRGLTGRDDPFPVLDKPDLEKIYASRPESIGNLILARGFFETLADQLCRSYWLSGAVEDAAEGANGEGEAALSPYVRDVPKIGRNDICPCGSGKKYKKCCLH